VETDALARDLGFTRAGVIARGLRAILAAEGRLYDWSSSD